MRVTVVGPGGVGGYLAARLATSGGVDVSVIARGPHLRAIRADGLRLVSPHGDVHVHPFASDDPAEVGPVDVVLLTVKATDVPAAAARSRPLVGPGTTVVTLQNGIDSHLEVARTVPREAVVPGVAYIFSTVASPGLVEHTAGPARFLLGEATPAPTGRAAAVAEVLADAGVDHEVVDDIDVALWSKFVTICATAGVTAPSRLPLDVLRGDAAARALLRRLADEAAAVGRAAGVALPLDAADRTVAFVDGLGPGATSSLLYDLEHGKPMELEALHGTILRLARETGTDVPATTTVYALLSPWARRNASAVPDAEPAAP